MSNKENNSPNISETATALYREHGEIAVRKKAADDFVKEREEKMATLSDEFDAVYKKAEGRKVLGFNIKPSPEKEARLTSILALIAISENDTRRDINHHEAHAKKVKSDYDKNLAEAGVHVQENLGEYIDSAVKEARDEGVQINQSDDLKK